MAGTDALLDLDNESMLSMTGGGTGTTENIQIGNNNARPRLMVDGGSKVAITTTSGTGAATNTTNNAIHLRGREPIVRISKKSEVTVNITSNARRGLYLNGAEAALTVIDSQLDVTTFTGQAINLTGISSSISMRNVSMAISTTTGNGIISAGSNSTIELINESEVDVMTTTGRGFTFEGANGSFNVNQSKLNFSATTGEFLRLTGENPKTQLINSDILLTNSGTANGITLGGENAILELDEGSNLELVGTGGVTENILIGNGGNNATLKIINNSQLSISTTSATTAATNGTNNAIRVSGDQTVVDVLSGSSVAINVTAGARRGLFLSGVSPTLRITDATLQVNTLTGSGIELNNGTSTSSPLFEIKSSEVTVTTTEATTLTVQGPVNPRLLISDGSKVQVTAGNHDAVTIIGTTPTLEVLGEDTLLFASSNRTAAPRESRNGTISLSGGNDARINVGNKAEFIAESSRNSAVVLQSQNGQFNVTNEANLQIRQRESSDWDVGGGTTPLRFVTTGSYTFTIDNAKMTIDKANGSLAAVRMFGGDNHIVVRNGGVFKVNNPGNGTASDSLDTRSRGNQGIDYIAGGNNSFTIDGIGSKVQINASSGAAITMTGAGAINVTNGGHFQATGRTSTAAAGILNAGTLTVNFDNPLFMDFRNNRPGGGNIFTAHENSTLTAINSDLSVWRNGVDLDGDPDLNFRNLDYSFRGTNFNTLDSTTDPDQLNTGVFGTVGLTAYSRMSSNNARWAIASELRVPTNADKLIHGQVSIPVGLEDSRPAWDDEAIVTVEVQRKNGEKEVHTAKTVGHSNDSPGISIYGEEPRGGLFEIELDDMLQTGDKVQIIDVELTSGELTNGFEHLILTETVRTFPIIPPTPVITSEKISENAEVIRGYSKNPEVEVFATYNGETFDTSDVQVQEDGTFEIPLAEFNLALEDQFQVFLRDKEGSAANAGVVNPPPTNNEVGNINPAEPLDFRDTTFKAATIITVSELQDVSVVDPLDPETEVNPENPPVLPENQGFVSIDFVSQFDFGRQEIAISDQQYFAAPQRLLDSSGLLINGEYRPNYIQVSDLRPENERGGWELSLTQETPFMDENGQELKGVQLTIKNAELLTAQSGIMPEIVRPQFSLIPDNRMSLIISQGNEGRGTWVYRFGNEENYRKSVFLDVPAAVMPQQAIYSTTLRWELLAVPPNPN